MRSKGRCRLCGREFTQQGIKRHLLSCDTDTGEDPVFLMKAQAGPFWVFFEIGTEYTLEQMDDFLRDLWMECCGHLSEFDIGGRVYISTGPAMTGEMYFMDWRLEAVLVPGLRFTYDYDMGSTTRLSMECVTEKQGSRDTRIVARNEMPEVHCEVCGRQASYIEEGPLCEACADEESLPLLNSPRSGECGFTGCRLIDA